MANKIALFGGGFNPIGLHHEQIAMLIYEKTGMKTWFMPCFDHQFDKDSELIDIKHRWNMVMGVANQFPDQMVAFDFEMRQKHTGSMFKTMEMLKPGNPDTDFHIVIGMDNANCIETDWDRGNLLIQQNPFIVLHRAGQSPTTDWFKKPPHMELNFSSWVSSSDIRNAVAEGNTSFARENLNYATWDYIKSENLFGNTLHSPANNVE